MKSKHLSLAAMFLVFIIVGLSAWYALHRHGAVNPRPGFEPVKPLSELKVPGKSVLEQMDLLERNMHLISAPPPQFKRDADLSALGYLPMSAPRADNAGGGGAGALSSSYRVTLAFDGQAKSYCVIDSELYPEGAVLPDGATIVKIESRRVLIAKESLQQWLEVDALLNTDLSDQS